MKAPLVPAKRGGSSRLPGPAALPFAHFFRDSRRENEASRDPALEAIPAEGTAMSEQPNRDCTDAFLSESALEAGLAAGFGPPSSVLRALSAGLPELPRVLLPEPDSGATSPVVRPGSEQMPAHQGPDNRYQLVGEIARGGMGCVFKGRDVDLGRDVAVKVLLEQHAGRTELIYRFLEEAQIAGQLQHPGIVPVYEMGQLHGRPFFSMKLIKGQTLARLLADRADLAQERPRLLQVFEKVCQTLAYAHSRGVIHRDLKPANVMVGAYGEVLVMDWGLAKVLGERRGVSPRVEAVTEVRTTRCGISDQAGSDTQAGSVMGTPTYMAPEQARGEVDLVDERADVFGLGAILCEVLTGQQPFPGPNAEAARKARTAALEDARSRLDGCGADEELVTLCRRCLAGEPWQRPRDAGVVAEAVGVYLRGVAERLRRAELQRAAAEAQAREERKRRRVTLVLAASVLLLVVLGGGAAAWWHQQRREVVRDVEIALAEAEDRCRAARWAEARAALERAEGRLGSGGPAELRLRLERARADVDMVSRLEEVRLRQADVKAGGFDTTGADRRYAAVFRNHGIDVEELAVEEAAQQVRGSAIRRELLAALDNWAIARGPQRSERLLAVADAADDSVWRRELRRACRRGDRQAICDLAARPEALEQPAEVLTLLGEGLVQVRREEEAIRLLRAALRRHPADFWLCHDLATLLKEGRGEQVAEAVGQFRAALALRPDSPGVWLNLSVALEKQGKVQEAGACCRKAIELGPGCVMAHNNLGVVLAKQGNLREAVACLRKAIELGPRFVKAHANLAVTLEKQGKLDEAVPCYHKAIEIAPRLAHVHCDLGAVLAEQGKADEAIACFRKAIEIDPRLARGHNNLGAALSKQGKLTEAVACFRKAIELEPGLILAHSGLAMALYRQGQFTEAEASTRRVLDLLPSDNPGRAAMAEVIQLCRHGRELEQTMPELLAIPQWSGSAAKALEYARVAYQTRRFAVSAALYARAFALGGHLVDGVGRAHRYNAACAAVLAGCGQTVDTALTTSERQRWRRQALTWLRADLGAWRRVLPGSPALVVEKLRHWQSDPDLAGLREPEALKRLPEEERAAGARLWADVAALRKSAAQAKQAKGD
jgi:serine/threonine-protein kinase